jgi:hypothetical protein
LKVSASLSYLTARGKFYFLVNIFSRHPVVYLFNSVLTYERIFEAPTTTIVSL